MKKISAFKIKKLLDFKLYVKVYSQITSTNIYAENIPCGAIFAHSQTDGHGRTGKKFFSGQGGLYFSLALPIKDGNINLDTVSAPFSPGRLTVSAGIAVSKTLISLGYDARIKWVNDIFVGGKKVCGILALGKDEKAILGIGVNLNSAVPDELSDIAASLGFAGDYNKVAAMIINSLARELSSPDMSFFNERCFTIGKTIVFDGGVGKAVGVDESGALLVESGNEVTRLFTGEAKICD